MNLELIALRWLWLEKKCMCVLGERCIRYWAGTPDAIGVSAGRYLIEIEIKRSLADFKADMKKRHRIERGKFLAQQPRQIYYLMPKELAQRVNPDQNPFESLLPEWAGLMISQTNEFSAEVVVRAPLNNESKKLTPRECVKVARYMTNHMMTVLGQMETRRQMDKHGWCPWIDESVPQYEI